MPFYEYRCAGCRGKTTVITLSVKAAVDPVCRHCGGRDMAKLVSRVVVKRSEESRLESLADPSSLAGLDESDPKSGSIVSKVKSCPANSMAQGASSHPQSPPCLALIILPSKQ